MASHPMAHSTRLEECDLAGQRIALCGRASLRVTVLSYGAGELSVLRRGTDEIPLVAGYVEEHSHAAIGLGTRCRHELNTGSCHPRVYGPEIFHVEEETDPASGLSAHNSGLVFSVSSREEQAGHGARRADHDPSLGAPVIGQGRGVLHELEAQHVHEEPDRWA